MNICGLLVVCFFPSSNLCKCAVFVEHAVCVFVFSIPKSIGFCFFVVVCDCFDMVENNTNKRMKEEKKKKKNYTSIDHVLWIHRNSLILSRLKSLRKIFFDFCILSRKCCCWLAQLPLLSIKSVQHFVLACLMSFFVVVVVRCVVVILPILFTNESFINRCVI